MGVVYAAYDELLDRKVALKVQPGVAGDARLREACIAEGRLLATVRHPSVVTVHEVGVAGDSVFLAMEFIDGEPLSGVGEGKSHDELWRQLEETAEGLRAAHAAGIVHGDVKPANILVDREGRAIVVDFGLARPMSLVSTQPEGVESGPRSSFGGTPAYVAPEQAAGRAMDSRSDQYAFAAMTWELLTGKRPFAATTVAALVLAKEEGPPKEDAPGADLLSRRELRALRRALHPAPEQRFGSIRELLLECRPPPRRWGGPLILGALGIFAAAIYFRPEPPPPAPDPCADAWSALDGLTVPESAPPKGGAKTSADLRGDARKRVGVAIDRWKTLARQNCEAHARGELDDRLYSYLEACSDRSVRALHHAAKLSEAEPLDKHRVLDALQTLAAIETCGPHRHGILEAGLVEGHLDVAGDGATIQLANEVGGLWWARKKAEARAKLPELERAIAESKDPLARAEGYRQLGVVSASREARLKGLSQAMQHGMRYRLDHNALVSAGDLINELKADNATRGEAQRVLQMTLLWSEAILAGEDSAHLRHVLAPFLGRLYNLQGILASDEGDLDAAGPAYRRALALYESELAWRPARSAFVLNNLAMLEAQGGNDEQAVVEFQRALDIVETYVGRDSWAYSAVALNVADHAASVGNWERVGQLLDQVRTARASRGQTEDSPAMKLLAGGHAWATGDEDEARRLASAAATGFEKGENRLMARLAETSLANYGGGGAEDPVAAYRALEGAGAAIDHLALGSRLTLDTLLRAGKVDAAKQMLTACCEGETSVLASSDLDRAHLAMLRARTALAAGEPTEAETYAREATRLLKARPYQHPARGDLRTLEFELDPTGPRPKTRRADLDQRIRAAGSR
jgi:predicted Ser/Thr protein kinase/tetratricopeptide (TPR) repeat protein